MKYIISESKLGNLIKLYFNTLDLWQWDIGDGEFHVSDGYEGEVIMSYTIEHDTDEGILHVRTKIINELKDVFGNILNSKELMKIICKWFNEKYDTNVMHYEIVMED